MNTTLRRRKRQQERGIPSVAWDPIVNLPGLRFLTDFNSTFWVDSARTIHPSAVDDRIYNFDDRVGSRHLRAIDDNSRAYYSTTQKNGIRMDGTNARGLWYGNGSEIIGAEQSLTLIIAFHKISTASASHYIGRGGVSGLGGMSMLSNGTATIGSMNFNLVTGGSSTTLTYGIEPFTANTLTVAAFSYDGTTARARLKSGSSMLSALSSTARTGNLSFHASDTAFWVGGRTADGTTGTAASANQKRIFFAGVTTDTFDDAGLVALVNNVFTYCGG